MDNKATTKRMIGAVVLVLVAALLLAALLRSKKQDAPDMAVDTAGETKPILGFPGVGGDDQKPSLVGEDPNALQQVQDGTEGQVADATTTGSAGLSADGIIPDVNLPDMAANTTGFDIRPPSDDKRQIVDTDGKIKDGSGNMGADATTTAAQAGAGTQSTGTQTSSGGSSASNNDKPAEPEKKPVASKPVLVGEKRVPAAPSAESVAAQKAAAAEKAAAAKVAAEKAAAEKAAADKSRELADAKVATGTGNNFAVQVMASSDRAKADAVANPLKADGHKVTVSKAVVNGKTVYRVQITGFNTRADATTAQASMKRRYTQNQYVQNSFVTGAN